MDDYKNLLKNGRAGSMDGAVEQFEGESVAVRFVDGQSWRFSLAEFETVTKPHDWPGEIVWQ